MAKQNTAPTMKDVAKEAGVSLGTVSKVINGIPVGEEYRKKVEQAIKELDYHLNAYARGLKSNRTNTIAVILPTIAHPYFGLIAHCINSSLQKRGYRMLLCDTDYDNEKEQEMIRMAEQNKVDGIITLTYDPKLEVPSEINSVSIDRYLGANIPCVASDNYAGGRLAAEKLMENGCRKLAFLRVGSSIVGETNKRKDGFVAACEAAGVPYEIKNLEDARDGTVFDPMAEFAVFLDDHLQDGVLEFDGIFCVTDRLAYQIVQLLRLMGLRVPEDVQVIGFDGLRTFGDMDYYCSTIVQPVDAIAETCVEVVLNENRANTPPCCVCRSATLTAAPPRHDRPGKRPVVLGKKLAALPLGLSRHRRRDSLGRGKLADKRPALGRDPAGLPDRLCWQKLPAGGYRPRH